MSVPDVPPEFHSTISDRAKVSESDAQRTAGSFDEASEMDAPNPGQTTDDHKPEQNLDTVDETLRAKVYEDMTSQVQESDHASAETPELTEDPIRIHPSTEPADIPQSNPDFYEKIPSEDASEQKPVADNASTQPVQIIPVSTSPTPPSTQKLTLKIQRSASSVHVMRDDIAKPEADLTMRSFRNAASPDLDEKPKLEILESTESKSNSESPVQLKVSRTAPCLPRKRPISKRKRVASGTDEEAELLDSGTEINGFVYYSACRSRNDAPEEQPAQISPATGRIRRRAAINNKLISGRIADTAEDEDNEEYVHERSKEHIPVTRAPKPVNDDPTAKLARVRASLAPFTKRSASAPTAGKTTTPRKFSAKDRISKKLGLSKKL